MLWTVYWKRINLQVICFLEMKINFIVLFGEDVAFGGVFRCSIGLREKYGINQISWIYFIFRL